MQYITTTKTEVNPYISYSRLFMSEKTLERLEIFLWYSGYQSGDLFSLTSHLMLEKMKQES